MAEGRRRGRPRNSDRFPLNEHGGNGATPQSPEEFAAAEARREAQRQREEQRSKPVWQLGTGVRDYADELIGDHFVHLDDANIVYLFQNRDRKRRGRLITSGVLKMNDFQRFIASGCEGVEMGAQFAVWLHGPTWEKATDTRIKSAMLDEALCRIVEDPNTEGDVKLVLRDGDFDGAFAENVQRYGAWRSELETAAESFRQLPLGV